MPLDHSFCTFTFTYLDAHPSTAIVAELDRKDASYKKRKVSPSSSSSSSSSGYAITLDDPFCDDKTYGELQAPRQRDSKAVTIVLHDPHETIVLESASSVRFSWKFRYHEHKFKFRKENPLASGPASLVLEWIPPREYSDDPSILVAQVNVKHGRTSVSILDHNLKRLQVTDIKGFEICLILSTFHFLEHAWETATGTTAGAAEGVLGSESKRLAQFRDPVQELQDVARSESIAAELRQDQASSKSAFTRLLRRHSRYRSVPASSSSPQIRAIPA